MLCVDVMYELFGGRCGCEMRWSVLAIRDVCSVARMCFFEFCRGRRVCMSFAPLYTDASVHELLQCLCCPAMCIGQAYLATWPSGDIAIVTPESSQLDLCMRVRAVCLRHGGGHRASHQGHRYSERQHHTLYCSLRRHNIVLAQAQRWRFVFDCIMVVAVIV